MKEPMNKWWERLQFTLLFLVFTVLLHVVFGWFQAWLHETDPYRQPQGQYAKVFRSGEGGDPNGSPGDRLRLFFWYGE
jgi:hypothetical protein